MRIMKNKQLVQPEVSMGKKPYKEDKFIEEGQKGMIMSDWIACEHLTKKLIGLTYKMSLKR